MGALLTKGTSADGVIVYQDDADATQFHYLPARAQCILGDTLDNFAVSYWGVNSHPYYVDLGEGNIINSAGGILAGQARIDISATQRENIVNAIKNEFKIDAPKLLPLIMSDIKVQPVFARNVVELGKSAEVDFPTTLQLGQSFIYNVSSGNSLFATLAAGLTTDPVPRADFGINLNGIVEFVGDPWEASIECDLSQVYQYTRTQVSASVKWGWFRIGSASYTKIIEDLQKNSIIKVTFKQGSGNDTQGRQMFDVVKQLFEKINLMAISGEGFFKFEPNPSPQGPVSGGGGGGWPWSLSINGSYSSTTFRQSIKFKDTFTYSGRVNMPMGAAMVLSVGCGQGTKQFFSDFQNVGEPCLTQAKLDGLQSRLGAEVKAKEKKALEYLQKLENGEWDEVKYRKLMAILQSITLTESIRFAPNKFAPNKGNQVAFFTQNDNDTSNTLVDIENMYSEELDSIIEKLRI